MKVFNIQKAIDKNKGFVIRIEDVQLPYHPGKNEVIVDGNEMIIGTKLYGSLLLVMAGPSATVIILVINKSFMNEGGGELHFVKKKLPRM